MIKTILKKILKLSILLGFNPFQFLNHIRYFPGFLKDYFKIKSQVKNRNIDLSLSPILTDKYESGGVAKGHYFHQDLYVAQKIYERNPVKHFDIGSRVDGFVAHVATTRKIVVIDIREITSNVANIEFQKIDMMSLDSRNYEICDSISCLHALEHFGLGRYGDPIDIDGHIKGHQNISKLLKPEGIFYFSTPIGSERIEFNNQRVFNIKTILKLFEEQYELLAFSFVDDMGDLHKEVNLNEEKIATNCGCNYGCGIFEWKKKQTTKTQS